MLRNISISDKMLGRGSFASVFKGTMLHNGKWKEVAVKKFSNDREHDAASAQKEFDVLSRLKTHKNIIQLLDMNNDINYIYLIMEYAELGDLEMYVKKNIPDLEQKIKIMLESATGINYMHSIRPPIIHRDIKPGNILMQSTPEGPVAKFCDFGIARIFNPEATSVYMSTNCGTLMYMAPELFHSKGRAQYTSAVDVFSLGLVYMGLLNVSGDNSELECIPESLLSYTARLTYAQHLIEALRHNTPMPALFTLTSADKWPVTELKAVITNMTAFKAADRMKIGDVEDTLQSMMSAYSSNTRRVQESTVYPVQDNLQEDLLQTAISLQQPGPSATSSDSPPERKEATHTAAKARPTSSSGKSTTVMSTWSSIKKRFYPRPSTSNTTESLHENTTLEKKYETELRRKTELENEIEIHQTEYRKLQRQYEQEKEARKRLEPQIRESSKSSIAVGESPPLSVQQPYLLSDPATSLEKTRALKPVSGKITDIELEKLADKVEDIIFSEDGYMGLRCYEEHSLILVDIYKDDVDKLTNILQTQLGSEFKWISIMDQEEKWTPSGVPVEICKLDTYVSQKGNIGTVTHVTNSRGEEWYVMTCKHVIGSCTPDADDIDALQINDTVIKDPVIYSAICQDGNGYFVDVALVKIEEDVKTKLVQNNFIGKHLEFYCKNLGCKHVKVNTPVTKTGSKTDTTYGNVIDLKAKFKHFSKYSGKVCLVLGKRDSHFNLKGDSGAMVFANMLSRQHAVGLISSHLTNYKNVNRKTLEYETVHATCVVYIDSCIEALRTKYPEIQEIKITCGTGQFLGLCNL